MSEIADVPEPIDRPSETNWDDELVFDRPKPTPAQPPADRADPTAPDPAEPVNPTNSIDDLPPVNDLNDPTADPAPPAAVAKPDQSIAPSEPLPTPEPAPVAAVAEPIAPIATDVPSAIAPEINSEIAPEVNPEINSEIHSEITADVAPELTPDATSAASVARLSDRVAALTAERDRLADEIAQARADMGRLLSLGTVELEQRRKTLLASIEQLERRQERIRQEMKGTFAGASQNVAARVQGFKDYLVGSLQELVAAAEELSLAPPPPPAPAPTADRPSPATATPPANSADNRPQGDRRKVEQLLERYRTRPDYYGPPWRLRRTFEQVHADRVSQWFFDLGARGALRTMGSRLQNILVVSAAISVLRAIHGDRLRTLILIDSPERLGDWRRGLQDSLGISRADFGAEQGIMLFESPDPLAQRADRIQRNGGVPFIIVDESDGRISLSLLQFPLWLAIAPDPRIAPPPNTSTYDYY